MNFSLLIYNKLFYMMCNEALEFISDIYDLYMTIEKDKFVCQL